MTADDIGANADDLSELSKWEAQRLRPATLVDVLRTENGRLIGAYILRGFRAAAVEARESRERVKRIRSIVLEMCDGDIKKAEGLLRRRFIDLGRQTTLQKVADSKTGAEEAIRFIAKHLHSE